MRAQTPLKRVAFVIAGQSPSSDDVADFVGEGRPFLQGNAEFGEVHPTPKNRCDSELRLAVKGDVLVSIRAPVGALNIADQEYGIGRGLAAIRPGPALHRRFCWWWMHSAVELLKAEGTGSTYEAVTAAEIGALRVPEIGSAQQRAIADFLDTETARIDALITKKQRMIDLANHRGLQHARHAVTLGCKYPSPLRVTRTDSRPTGVEPLKASWIARFGSGTTPESGNELYYGGGMPWVLTGDLGDGDLAHTTRDVTTAALRDYPALEVHPAGSIVVAMYGATIGRLGVLQMPATVNQACCVISAGRHVEPGFMFYYLLAFRDEVTDLGRGSGQPNISQEILRALRLPMPALDVQRRIVTELKSAEGPRRSITQRLSQQIDLLREHRLTLITAAVTGEIDYTGSAA